MKYLQRQFWNLQFWKEKFREYQNLLQKGAARKHSDRYLVESNSPIQSGDVLACLGYFPFILPRSCLLRLVAVCSGLFHIL